jgi:hypothetical protein
MGRDMTPRNDASSSHPPCRASTTASDAISRSDTRAVTIIVNTDEARVVDASIAALRTSSAEIFARGSALVDVIVVAEHQPGARVQRVGSAIVRCLPRPRLRELMSSAASYATRGARGVKRVHPPNWAVDALAARGIWPGIRPLAGVVEHPIIRVDGSILSARGYDKKTGLLCTSSLALPRIADRPTAHDVRDAVAALSDVVCDFPFPTASDRAAWLATLLTLVSRFAIEGPTPFNAIDANTPGAGKTLLADLLGCIVHGRPLARATYSPDPNEMRKLITSIAIEALPAVLFDNIDCTIGDRSLAAVLTATEWRDRVLGRNGLITVPWDTVLIGTGNGLTFTRELSRRTLASRLRCDDEQPEVRHTFRHPDLSRWVTAERARLLAAVLTILRGYVAAGRPDMRLPAWGSFEAWSALVRSAIVWALDVDPCEARLGLPKVDVETEATAAFLHALFSVQEYIDPQGRGVTTKSIFAYLARANPVDFVHAMELLCDCPRNVLPKPRALGMHLHHLRDRVVAGYRLVRVGVGGDLIRWRVEQVVRASPRQDA